MSPEHRTRPSGDVNLRGRKWLARFFSVKLYKTAKLFYFCCQMPRRFIHSAIATISCGWLLLFLASGYCAAAEPPSVNDYFVQSWQTDEGLPGNQVNDLLQGRNGYLWLATIGGLVRFDGMIFKQFTSPLIARVAARNIRALAETADSTLLMLPAGGGVVQLKDGQFSSHPIGNGLLGKQFQTLFVDRGGAVWLSMYDGQFGQVRRWQDGKSFDFTSIPFWSDHSLISFATDNNGGVWIAGDGFLGCYRDGRMTSQTNINLYPLAHLHSVVASSRSGGIWICDGTDLFKMDAGQFFTISTNLPWVALGGVVRIMFEDSNHTLWVGTSAHGLFRFADGKFAAVETSQSQITSITEDSEGDIWVATAGGGINRLRSKLFHIYNTGSGLPEDISSAVCSDAHGFVWLANRGGGVARIGDGKVSVLHLQVGTHPINADSVCLDDHGFMWVCSKLYRFPCTQPNEVQSVSNSLTGNITKIHVLFKSRNGDVWIGADPNLLGCFRGGLPENYVLENGFLGQRPRSITEDAKGRIWVGTEDGQLVQLAGGKFTIFAQKDGLPNAPIRSLYADADGAVWIGTIGGGIVLWRNEKFTVISVADGLPDDNIAEMLDDNAGNLWCGSRGGIFHVAKSDLLSFADGGLPKVAGMTFSKSEGLSGISCFGTAQPMACKTSDGRLWFTTQQGVLAVDSAALKFNSRPPPVFIDELLVNDRLLNITEPMRVPPLCNKIEFRFCALSYTAPEKVRIRYRLDGVDSDWVEIVNQRAAVYSALRPGKYQLHLKACNSDDVWNETGISLSFVVQPAWWQSWWFQGSMLMIFMTVSAMGIRYWSHRRLKLKLERLEHQQALAKERTRIANDIHDDLGVQLTRMGMLCDPERIASRGSEAATADLHRIYIATHEVTRAMDEIVWAVNPQHDTFESLVNYLHKFAQDFLEATSLRCRLDIPMQLPAWPMSVETRHNLFLAFKETLNNVVKHAQATEVRISLTVAAAGFTLVIEDNGRGFVLANAADGAEPQSSQLGHGDGLKNIKFRLKEVGGRCEITSVVGKGTRVAFVLPVKREVP